MECPEQAPSQFVFGRAPTLSDQFICKQDPIGHIALNECLGAPDSSLRGGDTHLAVEVAREELVTLLDT